MGLDLMKERGVPLDRQAFTWRDLVGTPISKLDDDAFTRMRVHLMRAMEAASVRFQHAAARADRDLQLPLAQVRRIEHLQQAMVASLLPPDLFPLEQALSLSQTSVEMGAGLAQDEPDGYVASVFRFGLAEDVDHLYRFAALADRLEGRDANNLLQSHTDLRPGRPTSLSLRAPVDDVRTPYLRATAAPLTRIHVVTECALAHDARDTFAALVPSLADPLARQLLVEIGTVKEQHVTQYGSLADPAESWLERWLVHEAAEVWCYLGCFVQERNPRVRAVWERLLACELGHLHFVRELFQRAERRDPAEVIPETLPDPLEHKSRRAYVRDVLRAEIDLRASGPRLVPSAQETGDSPSVRYRNALHETGAPSEIVAGGYRWEPGTELAGAEGRAR